MPEPAAQGHRARLSEPGAGGAAAVEPTLPELLRRGWRRAGLAGRIAGIAAAIVVLAIALWLLLGRGGSFSYDGPDAPPFSLSWGEDLSVSNAGSGGQALIRLRNDDVAPGNEQSVSIAPMPFERRGGEPLPGLALEAERVAERLPRGGRVVLEGRTLLAVDRGPEAYQLAYTAPARGDSIAIGKHLLVPDPDRPGEGVRIEIREYTDDPRVIEKVERAPAGFFLNWPIQLLLEDAASIRTSENLEQPLRTFEFG